MPDNYEPKTIQVTAIGAQGGIKRISCKADQNYAILKDGFKISFKLKDVRPLWCPGLFFGGKWKQSIFWRVGTSEAIDLDVRDTFIPVLSQSDTTKYIEKNVFDASNADKKAMKDWQFVVLIGLVAAVLVVAVLLLAGIHLGSSSAIKTIVVTVTPSPPIV